MAKRKARFKSLSTSGRRIDCPNYLVELAFLKSQKGSPLPSEFWKLQRYKWRYRREIQAVKKFIKKYGEPAVLYTALHNHITTWTDFARVEFLLQQVAERQERLSSPKDTSGVKVEDVAVNADYRDYTPAPRKKSIFERLKELERG